MMRKTVLFTELAKYYFVVTTASHLNSKPTNPYFIYLEALKSFESEIEALRSILQL